MPDKNFHFSGYVTKHNVKCSDGRVIEPGAFKENDGQTVPLVWQHMHNDPANILGHVVLENRDDGVYGYAYLNQGESAKNAGMLVHNKDISAFSIYANSLIEKSKRVIHGAIKEVSLVLSGANPEAFIDYIAFAHSDGTFDVSDTDAEIYFGDPLIIRHDDTDEEEEEEEDVDLEEIATLVHAEGENGETIGDVFNSLTPKQKKAVYAIIGQLMDGDSLQQSDTDEGDPNIMKFNVFEGGGDNNYAERAALVHSEVRTMLDLARKQRVGSFAQLWDAEANDQLKHSITNIDYLFPEARVLGAEPSFLTREPSEWVKKVMAGVNKSPFSRIKTRYADLTPDAARAKGYVTGAQKAEEVIAVLTRTTTPTTVYKLQKLDRDDMIDITDFNVVAWLKREMRMMLDEELSRAMLIGDGRSAGPDKIDENMIRPIYTDDNAYAHLVQVAVGQTNDDLIDDFITARLNYRGSGRPTLFVSPTQMTNWMLLKDADGRRLYRSEAELASDLRVKEVVEVPVMENIQKAGTPNYDLRGVMVNLSDYTAGADRGGEINMFDDFDIDFNKYSYLIETRMSGALTEPKSAIVLEQADA